MNFDLSSGGYALPLLIAGGLVAIYFLFKPKQAEGQAEPSAGFLGGFLKGGKLQLIPLLMAVVQNKDAIVGLVNAFMANMKQLFIHPDDKKPEPKEPDK